MAHEELLESLLAGDRSQGHALSRDFLRSTLEFAERYAKLEKLLFGGTRVAYSSAALAVDLTIPGDMAQQGEHLADAERVRFGLAAGPFPPFSFSSCAPRARAGLWWASASKERPREWPS